MDYYIFVNFFSGITRANLRASGHFVSPAFAEAMTSEELLRRYLDGSARYAPYVPSSRDFGGISPFCLSVMNDYRVEYDAEYTRATRYPTAPSRLSAAYAFGDFASCEAVAAKYGWDLASVRRFELVDNPLNKVARCNMEIVSLARFAYRVASLPAEEIGLIWDAYWTGHGSIDMLLPDHEFRQTRYTSGEIWEYLIEGELVLAQGEAGVPEDSGSA